ncbi:MAG: hypothetical protein ACREFJ_01395 [Acetobacteraceae bacterium]
MALGYAASGFAIGLLVGLVVGMTESAAARQPAGGRAHADRPRSRGRPWRCRQPTVSHLLAILLLITAAGLVARPWLLHDVSRWQGGARPEPAATLPATIAIGLVLGGGVTVCSVGAGALGTVALLILYHGPPASARIVRHESLAGVG